MSPPPCTTIRCEDDAWAERARVAQWAADELAACRHQVTHVLSSNYLGSGCTESPPVYADLSAAVSTGSASWTASLDAHIEQLAALSTCCAEGGRAFLTAETINAELFDK